MLRRFISYYRYYKGLFALDMTAALVSSLLSLLSPAIVRYILSTALPAGMFMRILQLLSLLLLRSPLRSVRFDDGRLDL